MEQQPRRTLDPQSAAPRPRPARPRPRPRRPAQPLSGSYRDRRGLGGSRAFPDSPRCGPASGLRPSFVRVVRAVASGSPRPRPQPSASRRSVRHTLLSKKTGSILSLAVDGVVVAVAVGRGRELLEGRARRALPAHVVPARTAVHSLAVRRGAHVGLGRLRCLAHDAAPTHQAAQKRAQAVQSVHQVVALLGGEVASLVPDSTDPAFCITHACCLTPLRYLTRCSELQWFFVEAWPAWSLPQPSPPICDCLLRVERVSAKRQRCLGFPALAWRLARSPPYPALLRSSPHRSSAAWSSAHTSSVWTGGVCLGGLCGPLCQECP